MTFKCKTDEFMIKGSFLVKKFDSAQKICQITIPSRISSLLLRAGNSNFLLRIAIWHYQLDVKKNEHLNF